MHWPSPSLSLRRQGAIKFYCVVVFVHHEAFAQSVSELSDLGVKYADKPRTDCRGDESVSTPASEAAAAAASMGQRFGNSTQLSFAVMNRT